MKNKSPGFSLIEILVVISIIGVLASVLVLNFSEGSAQSRDAERKSDLRNLQNAIELYKQRYGRYPEGCNGANSWSGQVDTLYECGDGTGEYIRDDLTSTASKVENFAPEFIPALPVDPKLNGDDSGYVYAVNSEGTVYKVMAKKTVESEVLNNKNFDFESCHVTTNNTGVCDSSYGGTSNSLNTWCDPNQPGSQFLNSYAVWGGYPHEPFPNSPTRKEEQQEKIICDIQ